MCLFPEDFDRFIKLRPILGLICLFPEDFDHDKAEHTATTPVLCTLEGEELNRSRCRRGSRRRKGRRTTRTSRRRAWIC